MHFHKLKPHRVNRDTCTRERAQAMSKTSHAIPSDLKRWARFRESPLEAKIGAVGKSERYHRVLEIEIQEAIETVY